MTTLLRTTQVTAGIARGAWPSVGSDPARGEVRSTAMALLILEAPYRFAGPVPDKGSKSGKTHTFNDIIGIGGGAGGKFGGRFGERRSLRAAGGSGTEDPLKIALAWLASNQAPDGSWNAEDTDYTVGTTGLALLAFLGDGSTTRSGLHRSQVVKGIKWLRDQQDAETGCIGRPAKAPKDAPGREAAIYEHAIASLAMCEAYFFSKNPLLKHSAQKAVDYALSGRNSHGVWRYTIPPSGDNDTSITSWMVFLLLSAQEAGLTIDTDVLDVAIAWLDEVTDEETGRVGYDATGSFSSRMPGINDRYPVQRTEALTAAGLLCRFFLGQSPKKTPIMEKNAELLLKALPEWDDEGLVCDMYYWYYGSYAMFQMGGKHWKAWNKAMKKAVLESQCTVGANKGSWDPIGPWGLFGGRVYSTAMMALTLEVYFRFDKVWSGR